MFVKVEKTRKGSVFVKELEKTYRSIKDLQKMIEKEPENQKYQTDLNDWLYYLENHEEIVRTQELILIKDVLGEN